MVWLVVYHQHVMEPVQHNRSKEECMARACITKHKSNLIVMYLYSGKIVCNQGCMLWRPINLQKAMVTYI